jgi:hypothetical protein
MIILFVIIVATGCGLGSFAALAQILPQIPDLQNRIPEEAKACPR